jgi:hypothetical protein
MSEVGLVYNNIKFNFNVPYDIIFDNLFETYYKIMVPIMELPVRPFGNKPITCMVQVSQLHRIATNVDIFPYINIINWLIK